MGRFNYSMSDFGGETTTVGIRVADASGDITAVVQAYNDIRNAIEGVTLEGVFKSELVADTAEFAIVPSGNAFAQRENKWRVRGVDANGNAQAIEIGIADLNLLVPGTENMDPTDPAYTTLVNLLNANWLSNAGVAVTVSDIIYVARTL